MKPVVINSNPKPATIIPKESVVSQKYDTDFYEFRPYFYAIFAAACFYFKTQNYILLYSGVLFTLSSIAIFYMRYFARHYR